jgi:hypothetical protein
VIFFEIDDCTNCKSNQWKLGLRHKERTEFECIACGGVVTVLLSNEQYRHLLGDA